MLIAKSIKQIMKSVPKGIFLYKSINDGNDFRELSSSSIDSEVYICLIKDGVRHLKCDVKLYFKFKDCRKGTTNSVGNN